MNVPSSRLETLSEIGRAVSSTLDLQALFDTIYHQVERIMDTTFFSIALLEPGRRFLSVPYMREDGRLLQDVRIPYGDNVTSIVIKNGTPLLFHTHRELEKYVAEQGVPIVAVGGAGDEGAMFVPLNTGSRTIGAYSVQSRKPAAYTERDLETLSIIASQAAVAIENARLFEQSKQSIRQMQALLQAARTLNSSHDLPSALQAILLSMRDVLPMAYGAIMLPDPDGRVLHIAGSIGRLDDSPRLNARDSTVEIEFGEGITGSVFEMGTALVVPDVREYPGYVDHELDGVYSEIAVPLKRGEIVVGVLDVGRDGIDAFSPDDLRLLTLFASQAAIAIENARLISGQRRRAEELQLVQSIIQNITPLHDPPEIASLISQELKQLIDYYRCRIFLLDDKGEKLTSLNEPDDGAVPFITLGEGFAGWIAQHGQADIVPSTLEDPRVSIIGDEPRVPGSMVGAPLVYEGKVRGAITLSKYGTDQFDENALRLLEIVAAQTALAFDRARLYQQLRLEATTDPVVRLWNRRYLLERFREERARALRHEHALACMILDIDRFKRINDTFGHDAGDAVLQSLAALLRRQTRTEDIAARYGGEEFCILLPGSSRDGATQLAERLRQAIERHRLPKSAGVRSITVSIGLAEFAPTDSGTELFTRADQAMYEAKAAGGNQVCLG